MPSLIINAQTTRLPVPVLCQMMQGGAARSGRRKLVPHDWPAAPLSVWHGLNRHGTVMVDFEVLPVVRDRLRYGIPLSSAIDVLSQFDGKLSALSQDISDDFLRCFQINQNEDALIDYVGCFSWCSKVLKNTYIHNNETISFAKTVNSYRRSVISFWRYVEFLMGSGDIELYGRRKSPEGRLERIPLRYFGSGEMISHMGRTLTLDKLKFFDLRFGMREGLPLHAAMLAYGDQESVRQLIPRYRLNSSDSGNDDIRSDIVELTDYLRGNLIHLLEMNCLASVFEDDRTTVEASLWEDAEVDLQDSTLKMPDASWRKIKVLTPMPAEINPDLFKWVERQPVRSSEATQSGSSTLSNHVVKVQFPKSPIREWSDNRLVEGAVTEDAQRAENGQELLTFAERLQFLKQKRPSLTANYLKTVLMPEIRKLAGQKGVQLRRPGNGRQ